MTAAARQDALYNRTFVQAMMQGSYPTLALEGLAPHLPAGWQDDMTTIAAPLDWFGVNYYTRSLVAPDAGPWPGLKRVEGPLPKTEMGWEIYPEGLTRILEKVAGEYTGDLPIYVTENGLAAPDAIEDEGRIAFIASHVAALRRAIGAGVPVRGYYVWSLLDNYEWALGYDKRFGIVRVDFDSLERTPKASYHALARALARS
jgi:beta-glucosidase